MQRMAFLDVLWVRCIRIAGYIFLAGWSEWCGGELSSCVAKQQADVDILRVQPEDGWARRTSFHVSLAILFSPLVVQYILVGHMQSCQPRQVQHEDPTNPFIKWQLSSWPHHDHNDSSSFQK
jgi:hypothetical protein